MNNAAYTHRPARQEDLGAIVAIYNSTIASREVTADTEPVSVASRQVWFDEHTLDRRPLWVAECHGEVLGWLSCSSFYGRPAYSGTVEVSIYIHEKARRQGLGRYFLEQVIACAPTIEVHTLLGFVFGHNRASLRLFEAFAFERWATMPRVATLDGVERDLVIVGKRVA
ncbi:MAG: N-acetyltransferase family protein [Herbaspirillum sp.]